MRLQNLHYALLFSSFIVISSTVPAPNAAAADTRLGLTPHTHITPSANAQPVTQSWQMEYAATAKTLEEADAVVRRLDMHQRKLKQLAKQLHTVGGDEQKAKLQLQDLLQKQQQVMQTMSNVSRQLHDTQMGIVRNMRD
jgi:hypothetical protein